MPNKAAEIWDSIKTMLDMEGDSDLDNAAIAVIASGMVAEVESLAQVSEPRIDFKIDKRGDGTPILVAVSSSIRKPEDGKVKVPPGHALIVRYKDGSVNILIARVPL